MQFEFDIILSYAGKDDEPLQGTDKGWVSNVKKFLVTLFTQISRGTPKILEVTEVDELRNLEEKGAVYIAILTEAFFEDERLTTNLKAFADEAIKKGNLEIGGQGRLFKVVKQPINVDNYLPDYEDLLPYDFYQIDPRTGEAKEFERFFGDQAERAFWMKLVDMAYDISGFIHSLSEKAEQQRQKKIEKQKTVYLANTGVDMIIKRDVIKRELMRHGYKVLPDHSLPKEANALKNRVLEDLSRCRMSIHLVGEDYGYKVKGKDYSVVDLQNKIASEYSRNMAGRSAEEQSLDPFSRLIWLAPDLKNVTERQRLFIEDLKTDAAQLDAAEVLKITLQEFKSIIRAELVTGGRLNQKREIKGYTPDPDSLTNPMIYLICDRPNLENAKPMKRCLESKGFRVVMPTYEGDLVDLRYIHQENLRRCDASIIYCGDSSVEWVNAKLQDLLKAPGFGRQKPIIAKALYQVSSSEINEEKARQSRTMILKGGDAFNEIELDPFLNKLLQNV